MFNVKSLLLDDNYTLDVKVHYALNYFVSGILEISDKKIKLTIFGEAHKTYINNYQTHFEILECSNYLNSSFQLLNVQLTSSHNARLSDKRGSFYDVFEIEELLYSPAYVQKGMKYFGLSFQSQDIVKWLGNTQLQQAIIDNYYAKKLTEIDTREFLIDLGECYLEVNYPITTYINSSEQKAGITFPPVINIIRKEECSFEVLKKSYQELLQLFYLLLGYDIKVSQVSFYSENNNDISYFYKQDLDRRYDTYLFLYLGHNLRFGQNRCSTLPLEIFQNYFSLSSYEKRMFEYYRKYKIFTYGEENFLGFYRILENIMFNNEELTEEMKRDLLKQESRENLSEYHIQKCKKLKNCTAYIKLLVFYKTLDDTLKSQLDISKQDIRDIVNLRNDITHFNEYSVSNEKIERYAQFLEFFTTYALLMLLNYPKKEFSLNMKFYGNFHALQKKNES
jgi:predicted NAD-dependent protein-ADP-ribosyltransferase YbiA (DUF1768 family)